MANSPVTKRYYPRLSSVVSTKGLPEFLGFLENDIINLLNKVYFKDFQYNKSPNGDAAHYSLSVVSPNRLDIEFFGTDVFFVLNPDLGSGANFNISSFPITLEYQWKVLGHLRDFDLSNFSFSPAEIYEFGLKTLGQSEEQALANILNNFVEITSPNNTSLEQFVSDIINEESITLTTPTTSTTLTEIAQEIYSQTNEFASIVAFRKYILTNDIDETKGNLARFFNILVPQGIESYIKEIITPYGKITLELSAGLEFPRTIFTPIYDENGVNPYDANDTGTPYSVISGDANGFPKVLFTFGEVNFTLDTEDGLDIDSDLAISSAVKAQIGNTGFNIEITNAKIDIWDYKNIEEADLDGRPESFKGVFIENLEVGLPKSLTPESGETAYIQGTNLLIGTEGGFSGVLSLEGQSLRAQIASLVLELTNFDIEFHQNSVENFDIKADLYIPGVKATEVGTDSLGIAYGIGDPGPIRLDITYTNPDYSVTLVSNPEIDIFGIDLVIHTLTFGFNTSSFNSLVFEAELFIPQLKAKSIGSNGHSSWGVGDPAPILLDTAYSNNPDTFTFTATDLPAINILGFELNIASCSFNIINGNFDALSVAATLLIPGVEETGTTNPAQIGLSVLYTAPTVLLPDPNYIIEATSFPTLNIFKIGLEIDELTIGFDKSSINTFDFKGELFIPNLKANGPGSNPKGSFADSAPAPIYFETSYNYPALPGADKIFSLTATHIPQINILGLKIDIETLGFDILNGTLTGFNISSFLFIPGIKAVTGGMYGLLDTLYTDVDLAPIGIDFSYDNTIPLYQIEFTSVPPIKIFGMELEIFNLEAQFDNNSVDHFDIVTEIKIPNLLVREQENGGTTSNLTPITEGQPYPIELNASYTGGGSDMFTFSAGSLPTFDFFGMEISVAPFSFSITDGVLSSLVFDAVVDLNMGGAIGVGFSYDGSEYKVEMSTSLVTLTLGGLEFDFSSFLITWNNGGITGSTIEGQMRVDGHDIDFEMGFTPEGWEIFAEDLGGVGFTIPNILGVTIYALKIGKRNGNFFVEVGKPSNTAPLDNTLGASLENLLNIPLVGKYLPSQLDIGFLSFEQGSGMDLSNAELKLLWPELEGLEISSTGSGLEAVIPINKTIFKTITINTLTVSMSNVDNNGEDETVLRALMDGTLEIGPILGTVSGVGLEATISYPSGGGNLGAANIDDFGIAGPDGIGLSIDTSGIKGGGYLSFDKEKGEYAGYLGLTIQDKISLNAIAILNTKFPDGSSGISLLIILTVEFNPGIQLGFGFNLSGLGGLFGLHRTMEIEPLRTGVKNGTIDHILFPDPATFVENAATHLSNIKAIFPVDHGRFVFGPMAKIGWGTPTLITAEVGLLLEVPKPVRLAILGVIKAILPDEDNDLIRLQINFLGLIDFGKKFISFDATIFDSKILTFAISGDMAFRLNYGDTPAFLLSVGGFHPKFNSPIPVPSMDRLMVKIVDKDKIKVILSTYFAVTSNTVQFGAKIDLQANIGSISAKGYFGLDTLFQFSPFYMIASISAGVSISYKDFDLAAIYLSGELEGPTPWKVNGTATFKIIGIEKSFSMSETFGEERTVTYESVDITSLVVEAIDDATNWQVTTGKLQDGNVVLKAQSTATNIISANGTLSITQRVVPLNYTIQKYGNRVPSGARTFSIASVAFGSGGTAMADLENIKEDFASAEYKNIDKSSKLSIPSFEKMDGGVKVNPPAGGLDYGGDSASTVSSQRDALYEKTLIDFVPDPVDPLIFNVKYDRSTYLLKDNWMQREVRGGAAAKSSASRTRSKLYGKTDNRVSIEDETFAVVSTDDLTTTYTAKTRLEAEELMELAITADPTLEGQLQIITNHRTL